MAQEAWYEKGNERAGLTRTQVPQQRHKREQEPTEHGGMVQTGKCGQTQRCAVMSGLWKQQKHPRQSWCCQLFAPRQAAEADRITPLQQHRGSETAVLGRGLASVPTSRAQEDVFLSFGRNVLPRDGWAMRPERRRSCPDGTVSSATRRFLYNIRSPQHISSQDYEPGKASGPTRHPVYNNSPHFPDKKPQTQRS